MRHFIEASLLAFPAASAAAAPAPPMTWGKAGVSLDQYRQDALDCGREGYTLDISGTDDAKVFVRASRQLDAVTAGVMAPSMTGMGDDLFNQILNRVNQQTQIVASARPEQRFRHIKQTLQSVVDQCLTSRGYSKFQLTDEQRRRLGKLKAGTDERRAYLYSLASDPAVVQAQAVAAQP
jgi:hypothetical protein